MSTTTDRMIPENYRADDLGDIPDFSDITPEMIEHYVRKGRQMRSDMLFEVSGNGFRALRRGLASLSQRLFGPGRRLGVER